LPEFQIESQRTYEKAFLSFINRIDSECPRSENNFLNIQHGCAIDQVRDLAEKLIEIKKDKNIPISDLPSAILVHGGPGIFGVSFFITYNQI